MYLFRSFSFNLGLIFIEKVQASTFTAVTWSSALYGTLFLTWNKMEIDKNEIQNEKLLGATFYVICAKNRIQSLVFNAIRHIYARHATHRNDIRHFIMTPTKSDR